MKRILAYNVFGNDLCDGIFYCTCYCLIPVIVTASSLKVDMNTLAFAYFYFTTFTCVLGSFYDTIMRIRKASTSFERRYLFIMLLPSLVIGIYSVIMIMYILVTETVYTDGNWILGCYLITVFIACLNLCSCIHNSLIVRGTL